ncbi:alpha/beta hydrolase [Kitasatospora sp. MMS16-BH015]|uniref:alpha/beta fold hydrolase n=1 Tax=Kitasatospora sp. MMS16-BH015 TaxID=2018025 RepID=UPI000CA1C2D1|nr:alpha/beta hydrolase [Kitasatospora sp. MMS16-BH015]AUG80889.1 alpha/beta hydrolase [Kitasatospora sp. MMS16-BH015]
MKPAVTPYDPAADCIPPAPDETLRIRSADGHWIHAEAFGPAGAPLVVLAHGWTCSIRFWAPVIRQLTPDYRVVAYDQRGHGGSDRPPTQAGYSTTKLADDLEAVLRRVVPEGGRAVLAGHSMGGMTIMAAADRTAVADRTAAAVLVSTGAGDLLAELAVLPPFVRSAGARRLVHKLLLESRMPLGKVNGVSSAALKYATMGPASSPARVRATAEVVHACPTSTRHRWSQVLGGLDEYHQLPKLTAPTAVIVGSHDRLTPPVHARRIEALLPDSHGLLELPGVGHMSPVERPAEVAGEIRRLAGIGFAATRVTEKSSATKSATTQGSVSQ